MEKRTSIPPAAFIVIGSAMILMSVFIDLSKLSFFVFVGAIFIAYAFIKILVAQNAEKKRVS
jgi:1,4-dihydroxy-2-naphthoate octaprenyltransferase